MLRKLITLLLLAVFSLGINAQEPAPQPRVGREDSALRNAFLPGLSGSYLVPFESSKRYQGGSFHYAFIQGITTTSRSQDFGGYYETYAEIGFYKEQSSAFNADIFFSYSLGVNLSFEKFLSSSRNILIPYFGARAGGIYINDPLGSGESKNGLALEPVMGLVIVMAPILNINYDASLFLNTVDLPGLIGVKHSLVFNVNF